MERNSMGLRNAALRGALLLVTISSVAHATPSSADVCITHNDNAIALRKAGKLLEARTEFVACAAPECPAAIRSDCEAQLVEVRADIPTIVFEAKDPSGNDVDAVTVTLDDHPEKKTVSGTLLEFDPGKHLFTFSAKGQAPVALSFVLRVGDKHRHERVTIGPPGPLHAPQPPVQEPETSVSGQPAAARSERVPPVQPKMQPQRLVGLTTAGVGVVGLAVGAVFGALGFSEKNKQIAACTDSYNCPNPSGAASAHSAIATDSTIANIGIIGGAALVATGAVLFLTGGGRGAPASARLYVTPTAGPRGSGVLLQGEF